MRSLAEIRQRRRAGGVAASPPGQTLLRRPPAHSEDPSRLVPGAVEELLQAALQPLFLVQLTSLAQGEDAGGGVAASLGSHLAAVAAQQHVETAGARRWQGAALGHAVSVAGQLRQKQHQHQGQKFLLDTRDRRCSGNSGASRATSNEFPILTSTIYSLTIYFDFCEILAILKILNLIL